MTFITLISKDKQIKGQSLIPTRPRYHKSGSIFISLSFILLSAQKPIRVYIDIIVDILAWASRPLRYSPTLFLFPVSLLMIASFAPMSFLVARCFISFHCMIPFAGRPPRINTAAAVIFLSPNSIIFFPIQMR